MLEHLSLLSWSSFITMRPRSRRSVISVAQADGEFVYVMPRESTSVDLNFGDILETRAILDSSDGATFSARGLVDFYLELLLRADAWAGFDGRKR